MAPPYVRGRWYHGGQLIEWIAPEHCLLLVGYDDNNYIFNDPQYHKNTYYAKSAVEAAYAGMKSQAVTIVNRGGNLEIDLEKLNQIDIDLLSNTHYYVDDYNSKLGDLDYEVPSDMNDYNILACLQTLYLKYYLENDFEKTDYFFDEVNRLRKMHPSYRTKYAEFLNTKGEFELGYIHYASGKKTCKLKFQETKRFTKEEIRKMHQTDDIVAFLAGLIPGIGYVLEPLMSLLYEEQQNGTVDLFGFIFDIAFNKIINSKNTPWLIQAGVSTYQLLNILNEGKETYIEDGVTVQEGDSYIDLCLYCDMGIEKHFYKFYFRNNSPYVVNLPQYRARTDDNALGQSMSAYKRWKELGYQPSERPERKGTQWPGYRE